MEKFDFFNSPPIDQVGIEDRIFRITARSIKKEAKIQGLLMTLNMIDLTTLEGADTDEKVKQLCFKAHHLHDELPGLPTTAAVCVYPNFVKLAVNELKGTGVKGNKAERLGGDVHPKDSTIYGSDHFAIAVDV